MKDRRGVDQRPVALVVTEPVVDDLEVVDVDEQQRVRDPVSRETRQSSTLLRLTVADGFASASHRKEWESLKRRDSSIGRVLGRWTGLLVVCVLILGACDGQIQFPGGAGEAMPTPTAGGSPGEPGQEAIYNLIASPDNGSCNYVPNGHQTGADLLNVHFFFLIINGNPPDVGFVSVAGTSDTGLSTSYNGGPNNEAVNTAQFALRSSDFGRTHTVTITVDSAGEVPETDEADNRISVTVALPSPRPATTVDPLSCSMAQG